MPPEGTADGETITERGAVRYLGVYFSFEGRGGNAWPEQDECTTKIANGFFASIALVEPTVKQYNILVQSLLVSRISYGGRIRPPPEATLESLRRRTAQGLTRALQLGSIAKSKDAAPIDAEMLLTPTEAIGGGVPDIRAELLGEIAVDVLAMLESTSALTRAAATPTEEQAKDGTGPGRVVQLLRSEAGVRLHRSTNTRATTTMNATSHDELVAGTAAPSLSEVEAAMRAAPLPQSTPDGQPGDFEAEARLTVRPTGLLFRALRHDEVEWRQEAWRLKAGALRPRQRVSRMGVDRAVAEGSSVKESEFVHTTADVCVAAFFATADTADTSGWVAVLDQQRLPKAPQINLQEAKTRRANGIAEGSKADGAAIAAAEVLLDMDEVAEHMLVRGAGETAATLMDLRWLRRAKSGGSIGGMLSSMSAEQRRRLAWQLYKQHDLCDMMRGAPHRTELSLVTDASVQSPHGGIMAKYVEAEGLDEPVAAAATLGTIDVTSELSWLAETRDRTVERIWKTRVEAAGLAISEAAWREVDALAREKNRGARITESTKAAAEAVEAARRDPQRRRTLCGENDGLCPCVGGGVCALHAATPLRRTAYQKCVSNIDKKLEHNTWRRAKASKPDDSGDNRGGGGDGEPTSWRCVCRWRGASAVERAFHWALTADDGDYHGLPPDERKRIGAAWVLVDEPTGRVVRAGRRRIAATGLTDDYSTKAEGQTILEALRDVLPLLPPGTKLRAYTDSAAWTMSWAAMTAGGMRLRRLLRKPDTGPLRATKRLVGSAATRLLSADWQPAEHNLAVGDDRRSHPQSRANRAADAGAGRSAEGGRDIELDFFKTHEPPPDADVAFFTSGGAPVTGDLRVHVQRAVRLRTAARVASPRDNAKARTAVRLARQGKLDAAASALARAMASPATEAAMLRALLGRMRSAPNELLRRPGAEEATKLRRVLRDRRCPCGSGDNDTRTHFRTNCELAAAAMRGVNAIGSAELARIGCSFWFDVERRVGFWNGTGEEAALGRAGWFGAGFSKTTDGLLKLDGGKGKDSTEAAVLTQERLACLGRVQRGGDAAEARAEIAAVLHTCIAATTRARLTPRRPRQEGWQPGRGEEDAACEATARPAEGPPVSRTTAETATTRLARVNAAEKAALQAAGAADDEVLAAAAYVLGFGESEAITLQAARAAYHRLSNCFHPGKTADAARVDFELVHAAGVAVQKAVASTGSALLTPPRLPPLRPTGVVPRAKAGGGPSAAAQPPRGARAGGALESADAVRQVPPALRQWLDRNVLGENSGEAMTSPLTFTTGIFEHPPSVHEALVDGSSETAWTWGIERVSTAAWRTEPWRHNVLITLDMPVSGQLQEFAALFEKMWRTAKKGRRVVLLLSTEAKFETIRKLGFKVPLHLPPGSVPWGDAVGWPDRAAAGLRATHSWSIVRGVPTAAKGEAPKAMQRHSTIANPRPVWCLVAGQYPEASTAAQAELAYILAGTGCGGGTQHATWRQRGKCRPLDLWLQCEGPGCEPLRPLRHCAWQDVARVPEAEIAASAGLDAKGVTRARGAAKELRNLGENAERGDCMVPDGTVPAALCTLLLGVGAPAGEVREAAARVVVEMAAAVQRAELARARAAAAQLAGLGLHLPELIGGAGERTAQCLKCGCDARRLFHVEAGTPQGDKIIAAASELQEEVTARRVQTHARQTRDAVRQHHSEHGVHVCVACAAPRMAEERVHSQQTARIAASTARRDAAAATANTAATASAAARVLLRRSEVAVTEATALSHREVTPADEADALWGARRTLARAPQSEGAFPGVRCVSATTAEKERVNPLEPGDTRLVGRQFDWDGRRWYIESYAIMDGSGAVGFYAFDTRRWTSATLLLGERCQRFDGAALLDLEIQLGTQQAKTNAARAEAFMLQLSMPAATERPERRRIRGRVSVGKVGGGGSEGDEVEARRKGWLPVYVGRNTQRLLDFAGGEGLGCPGRINAKDNAAREATCQLCAQLEREPLTFAWTEAEGVERLDHMLTRIARRNRDKALDRCAEEDGGGVQSADTLPLPMVA